MEHVIWVEKYRPQTISECILPSNLKKIFQGIVDSHQVPNMILSGPSGMGKTTVAKAICNELELDYIMINASEDRNIDTLRTSIKQFASSMSFSGKRKIVIFDEADHLNPQSTQPALRGFIEEFAENCGFIFTCNYKNKIIQPIHSRCSVKDFKIPKEERTAIYKNVFLRVKKILDTEKVKYDSKVIADLIPIYFPDYRRLINELQTYSKANGEINEGILSISTDLDVVKIYRAMKEKDYGTVREWVVDNLDNDPIRVYRKIYDTLKTYLKPTSIPLAVVLLAEYQYKSAFSVDQEICLLAFLTRMMVECEWT